MTPIEVPHWREHELFVNHLHLIATSFALRGLESALVGGRPLKADMSNLGLAVTLRRSNNSIGDIDVQALGPDRETIQAVQVDLSVMKKTLPFFPEVGLDAPIFPGDPQPDRFWHLLSSLKIEDGVHSLVFRDIEVAVPPETVALRPILVNGVEFMTFPRKTLAIRYLTRLASYKPKDLQKLGWYAEIIREHRDEEPPDYLYLPYQEFVAQVRAKYPHSVAVYRSYWGIDNMLSGRISGSGGFLYDLIKLFHSAPR